MIRQKSGPDFSHLSPDFDRLGMRFVHLKEVRAPIFRARGPIFTRLYNEKSIFKIGVHDFREKRHILKRRLCRSGGRPLTGGGGGGFLNDLDGECGENWHGSGPRGGGEGGGG